MRVLEVLATLKRAGAEHVATSLACRLDAETAIVSLFDAFPGGYEPLLERSGVRVWHLGKRPGLDPRMFPRLARVMREFRPDVVHTHSYVLRYVLPVARRARIVHTVHNVAGREVDAFGRVVHRIAWRRGAVPVAVSKEVACSFRRVYGFEPELIPNGIDTAAYRRPPTRAGEELVVVSVARLDPQKNPLGLIEAFERVPRGRLVLAGAGSLLEAVRGRPRVEAPGAVEDVPDLLASADIFALASDWEGSPVAIMEAMAAGLPVVATAVGGVPELVEHGVTGLLVPRGDMRALGDALAALAADPARRRSMGDAARRSAARFALGPMVSAYAALFRRLA